MVTLLLSLAASAGDQSYERPPTTHYDEPNSRQTTNSDEQTPSTARSLAKTGGFRGLRFGSAVVLDAAPMESCSATEDASVRWACSTTIGEERVQAVYMVEAGFFYAVMIKGAGYQSCDNLKRVYAAAWGEPAQPNQYVERFIWSDGAARAVFAYETVDHTCSLVMFDSEVVMQLRAARRDAANRSVEDL